MSNLDDILDGIAQMAGRTIAGGGSIDLRVYDLYGVERGDDGALAGAIRDLGDPTERIRDLCTACGLQYPPPGISALIEAINKRKVVFKRTTGGAPEKWRPQRRQELLAMVERIKATKLCSDGDALGEIITENPELLKTFCREKTWRTLLNSKGQLKPRAKIAPVINTLNNQLSIARHESK
jgi:hypothetical protein